MEGNNNYQTCNKLDPYENEMRESMEGSGEIQFPLIYNYLKN